MRRWGHVILDPSGGAYSGSAKLVIEPPLCPGRTGRKRFGAEGLGLRGALVGRKKGHWGGGDKQGTNQGEAKKGSQQGALAMGWSRRRLQVLAIIDGLLAVEGRPLRGAMTP